MTKIQTHKNLLAENGYHGWIGQTSVMQSFINLIEKVAAADAPIVITGQSGTGKALVARTIHDLSPRCSGPFIEVNCTPVNGKFLDSELFGYVKGTHANAGCSKIGRFEAAHEGTLFLDEIGDIPPEIQIKLLRTLEEKAIERVGESSPVEIDVRILSASNKNLDELIADGQLREDLYFRLNVIPITCPPLCDHAEDIPILVEHLIQSNNCKTGKKIVGATPEAIAKMTAYGWPGNIKELQDAIDYAFASCSSSSIGIQNLPAAIRRTSGFLDNADLVKRAELVRALKHSGGNRSEAARILGVSRVTVWKQINKFGIDILRELTA